MGYYHGRKGYRCLTYHREKSKSSDIKKAWDNRLRLKAEIDSVALRHHDSKNVIKHFKDADREVPIWAIFAWKGLIRRALSYARHQKPMRGIWVKAQKACF